MEQTELKIINTLLGVIGESPVNQIDLGHPDVVSALDIWTEYSDEIQSNGWWYNLETWELQADTEGKVNLPPDVIAVDGPNIDYIKKGRYLYDKGEHTYDFSDASDSDLTLNLLTAWEVDEVPPVMFNYILSIAKLKMLMNFAFDANKATELKEEGQKRYFLVQKHNLRFSKPNKLSTSAATKLLNKQPTR